MLYEAIGLVGAVEPAFRGYGTLACLLLQPANTAIVGTPANDAYGLPCCITNGKNDPAGEIVAIITGKGVFFSEIDLLAVIAITPGTFVI